ncbi:MAG: glutamine synthetase beta-grasp domain-containing protein [Methanomicrobia archaeon]|nr:glutamine synthetase beta-grasp domain-containing protein [Methanomicrobia archaeon]MCK4433817.1 glutamine synthetase beta-grasp domain-containing protein [Methanomicrobia archaeon]MCK4637427.1 glutamine synthetase beta-grasp domain-containing protein [Methanomicrobia archaeon]
MTERIYDILKAEEITFLRLQFVDVNGIVKSMAVPAKSLETALTEGIGFDGSSIEGFSRISESDMNLKPDPDTFSVFNFNGRKEGRFICDVYLDDEPFNGDPRFVLKKNIEEMKKILGKKAVFNVGAELEFFLLNNDMKQHDNGSYFDFAPVDLAHDIRKNSALLMMNLGIDYEASHHEVGKGQHEIDFKFSDALRTADSVVTSKIIIKIVANLNDLTATFMPKPFQDDYGNGMHTHLNLSVGEKNLFEGEKDFELSQTALSFIAGILKHSKAICAVSNPTVNSYKRLIPGYEAPAYISWGRGNRSSLIRIPKSKNKRIEFRVPDASCNPYLTFSVLLKAGLDGVINELQPPSSLNYNLYDLSIEEIKEKGIELLPSTLKDALKELKKDPVLKDSLLGAYGAFIRAKWKEWDEYRLYVTRWEFEKYLNI